MELSELVAFNGEILTVCDKTGIVFKVLEHKNALAPYLILADGDGFQKLGFGKKTFDLSFVRLCAKLWIKERIQRGVDDSQGGLLS